MKCFVIDFFPEDTPHFVYNVFGDLVFTNLNDIVMATEECHNPYILPNDEMKLYIPAEFFKRERLKESTKKSS